MHILIVEDDYQQAELIENALRQEPDFAPLTTERVSTESGFRAAFEGFAARPPDVVIMDVMLRWADPAPGLDPPPPEIKKEGFHRAGLRNERLLAADPRTRAVPVVLYTVLGGITAGGGGAHGASDSRRVHYLPKDSTLKPLVDTIRELVRGKVD